MIKHVALSPAKPPIFLDLFLHMKHPQITDIDPGKIWGPTGGK